MSQLHDIQIIGAALGVSAANPGCVDGPQTMQDSDMLQQLLRHGINAQWLPLIKESGHEHEKQLSIVLDISQRLAQQTQQLIKNKQRFVSIGGCHSTAIGIWSGVASALKSEGDVGLIWIDAHMDSHTYETTISGNIHGMPVAVLLGEGYSKLTSLLYEQAKIKPENICLIGVRDYQASEAQILAALGVKIFPMQEVDQLGFAEVFQQALQIVKKNTVGFGVSIDIDALDPSDAPGTGMHVQHGIRARDLLSAMHQIVDEQQFVAMEIAEFDPHQDVQQRTEQLIIDIIASSFSAKDDHIDSADDMLGPF